MKVAVIGASGSTGRLVVERLLRDGAQVVRVVRRSSQDATGHGDVVERVGEVTSPAFLRQALADCDAVISCLGQRRRSKSLFAARVSPPDLLQRAAAATVAAIAGGRQHLIYLSAFGVGDDLPKHALLFRAVLRMTSLKDAYADHAAAEAVIKASGATWTILRPPGLTDDPEEVPLVDKSDRWTSFETASKRSVAAYLADCALHRRDVGQVLTIGKG
ncbi:NAD(P)-dependent oxidoreductase [Roseateles chitinivorans]|uniref:NAD(P)-dependent oxidoreductase n=1 Tax=Roseateles chitinivorans TaxID=2917965 RepID=UPI003D673714